MRRPFEIEIRSRLRSQYSLNFAKFEFYVNFAYNLISEDNVSHHIWNITQSFSWPTWSLRPPQAQFLGLPPPTPCPYWLFPLNWLSWWSLRWVQVSPRAFVLPILCLKWIPPPTCKAHFPLGLNTTLSNRSFLTIVLFTLVNYSPKYISLSHIVKHICLSVYNSPQH